MTVKLLLSGTILLFSWSELSTMAWLGGLISCVNCSSLNTDLKGSGLTKDCGTVILLSRCSLRRCSIFCNKLANELELSFFFSFCEPSFQYLKRNWLRRWSILNFSSENWKRSSDTQFWSFYIRRIFCMKHKTERENYVLLKLPDCIY